MQSLGPPAPVSRSPLWELLESFFRTQGVAAWDEAVPYFITNSAAAAQVYAELILAFVRDLGPDPEGRPLTILELGTGLGRLGFLLCRELERQREFFASTRAQPIRLVLSDIAEENVLFWESHPSLAPYAESGMLDFACYNPLRDDAVRLRRSGEILTAGSLDLPLVVLANYVFCSLPHDEFRLENHELQECRVELLRADEPRFPHPDIRDVTCQRIYEEVRFPYYSRESWDRLLEGYRQQFSSGAVTVPVGALTALERLQSLSTGGLLLLASDRGYTSAGAMAARPQHDPDVHQGGFSFLVNFNGLGSHFEDGLFLSTSHDSSEGVHTAVGAALPAGTAHLECLRFCFREHLDRVNRINAASLSLSLVREGKSSLQEARALLAFLQLNLGDPYAVTACVRRLIACGTSLRGADRRDLLTLLDGAADSFYAFQGAVKLPHALAHLYRTLGLYERAVESYDRALAEAGNDASLHLFRAVSLQRLGRLDEALVARGRAVELDPTFADLELDYAV